MTPLERAARALCSLDGHPENAKMDGKPLWRDYLPEARAVLRAIRDPSPGAVSAAANTAQQIGSADHVGIYRAIIDAMLVE